MQWLEVPRFVLVFGLLFFGLVIIVVMPLIWWGQAARENTGESRPDRDAGDEPRRAHDARPGAMLGL
jgi:hypothetical protein